MNQNQFFKNLLLIGTLLLLIITLFMVSTERDLNKATNPKPQNLETLSYLDNPNAILEISGKVFTKESEDAPNFTEHWLDLDKPLLVRSGFRTHYIKEILLNPSQMLGEEGLNEFIENEVILAGKLTWGTALMIEVLDLYSN
jgi:hypothetical protein